jgi:tetratricopeptide (TPR) repeat protein
MKPTSARRPPDLAQLLARLPTLPAAQRRLRLANDSRVKSGEAAEWWFQAGPRSLTTPSLRDATVGVELVEAATDAVQATRAEWSGLAYLDLSNAHAALDDQRACDAAFERALSAIDALETGAHLEALLMETRAEQLATRIDFAGALRFADRALRLRAEAGDLAATIGGLRRRARLLWRTGDRGAAIAAAKDALAATPSDGSLGDPLRTRLEIAEFLCEAGAPHDALATLLSVEAGELEGEAAARWHAVLGLAARNVGSFQRAERSLRLAVSTWLDLGRAREASQATCELSLLLFEQGRGDEIAHLARNLRGSSADEFGSAIAMRLEEAADSGEPALPLLRALETELRQRN